MNAGTEDIGFLVVGDPLCATTHTDLILRARAKGIPVEVIHNASAMGAVASCGLQLYQFGYTVSIPLFEGTWRPSSFYDRLKYNRDGGMHTLCLLDIKVNEPDYESMSSGKLKYLPPRFMTINVAIEQLLEIEEQRKEGMFIVSSSPSLFLFLLFSVHILFFSRRYFARSQNINQPCLCRPLTPSHTSVPIHPLTLLSPYILSHPCPHTSSHTPVPIHPLTPLSPYILSHPTPDTLSRPTLSHPTPDTTRHMHLPGYAASSVRAVGMARLGQPTQRIVYGTLGKSIHVHSQPYLPPLKYLH